jgi:hypothetical protein
LTPLWRVRSRKTYVEKAKFDLERMQASARSSNFIH